MADAATLGAAKACVNCGTSCAKRWVTWLPSTGIPVAFLRWLILAWLIAYILRSKRAIYGGSR